jgi:CubicO group peptidase (beta-lactamase class C family)
MKKVQGCCWVLLAVLLFGCEQKTQHSKVKESKDWLTECMGSALTPDQELAIRKKINAEEKIAQLEEIFQKKRRAGFNGNVLVAQRGVVLYNKSFGYAHLRQKDPLNNLHTFQLASLSKPFTAVAVLKLQEAGKISLEDSVQRFFPDFPYRGVQIKSLLSHRSGLPNYAYAFMDSVRRGHKYPTNTEVMRWFATVRPTPQRYNVPGRSFSYSNTNYLVLAAIVEKVSGMAFDDYLQKHIFAPLDMTHTLLGTQPEVPEQHRTAGHQSGRVIPKDYYDNVVGDKGIYSTTEDLYRFYKGLMGGCLLSKRTLKEAFAPRSFERRGFKNYGYGFRLHLNDQDETRYMYHTGWWKGYNTIMWISPEDDFVVIMLSNSYNRTVYEVKDLLETLHGRSQSDDVEKDI